MGKPVTVYQNGSAEAIPTIDYGHQKIHEGYHFTAFYYVTVGASTAVTVLITPPAAGSGREIHFLCGISTNNTGIFTFSENPVTTAGTLLTSANNYRSEAVDFPDPVVLSHTCTVDAASVGTVLETILTNTTTRANVSQGSAIRDEWILDGTYRYLMRFAADNAATRVIFHLSYYYEDE